MDGRDVCSGGGGYGLYDSLSGLETITHAVPCIRGSDFEAELKMYKRIGQGGAERTKRRGAYQLKSAMGNSDYAGPIGEMIQLTGCFILVCAN